jgi:hypothetical protein
MGIAYGNIGNGLSIVNPAPSAASIKKHYPSSASGLYWIKIPGSKTAIQTYCDMTTQDAKGRTGWMLVASWDTASNWTLISTSTSNVLNDTPYNGVSSNFGNTSINQFRVQVASSISNTATYAEADWYYNWNNNTSWKEVWAPDGDLTYHYLSQGTNPAVPRASIKQFDNSYNIKGNYNNTNHKWNNISDYGYQNSPLPGGIAAIGGTSAPLSGICPFWTALTIPGSLFGAYNIGRTANFAAQTGPDSDGTLAIPSEGAGTDTSGQDIDTNIGAKYGYDDGGGWASNGITSPANGKMFWWIK